MKVGENGRGRDQGSGACVCVLVTTRFPSGQSLGPRFMQRGRVVAMAPVGGIAPERNRQIAKAHSVLMHPGERGSFVLCPRRKEVWKGEDWQRGARGCQSCFLVHTIGAVFDMTPECFRLLWL